MSLTDNPLVCADGTPTGLPPGEADVVTADRRFHEPVAACSAAR